MVWNRFSMKLEAINQWDGRLTSSMNVLGGV